MISPPALLVTLPIVALERMPLVPSIVPELVSVRTEVPAAKLMAEPPLITPLLVNVPADAAACSENPTPPLGPTDPLLVKAPSVAPVKMMPL